MTRKQWDENCETTGVSWDGWAFGDDHLASLAQVVRLSQLVSGCDPQYRNGSGFVGYYLARRITFDLFVRLYAELNLMAAGYEASLTQAWLAASAGADGVDHAKRYILAAGDFRSLHNTFGQVVERLGASGIKHLPEQLNGKPRDSARYLVQLCEDVKLIDLYLSWAAGKLELENPRLLEHFFALAEDMVDLIEPRAVDGCE
jgi:hypothetical protein